MSTATTATNAPIVIRPWPKLIFLWPSAVLALVMWMIQLGFEKSDNVAGQNVLGGLFLLTLSLNLVILAFQFPRWTWLTVLLCGFAGFLGLLLLNHHFNVIAPLKGWVANRQIRASQEFYLFFFLFNILLFAAMYVVTRFDYWELSANELIHHHGPLADVERFSTAGLKLNKEISDIFEYAICGAGTIVLTMPGNPRPVILENVMAINGIEKRADQVLNARVVRIEQVSGAAARADEQVNSREEEAE